MAIRANNPHGEITTDSAGDASNIYENILRKAYLLGRDGPRHNPPTGSTKPTPQQSQRAYRFRIEIKWRWETADTSKRKIPQFRPLWRHRVRGTDAEEW